eukprot:CAMPEP_0206428580 /NCGR_PEP_ID=MMETSP0324_2-20121206/5755_1 /ASSEMBLY_ACC=CAM_ASM_000836 /TAXON_ID=2866 /ORGANISM="Crypthecodinium cohnii, Strain Seligo" /LENGTH=80 /DNA_ID=CAMNT_0053894147 /DNA_START=513 /DNA_END=751 /DNA_ORIENTATION=+
MTAWAASLVARTTLCGGVSTDTAAEAPKRSAAMAQTLAMTFTSKCLPIRTRDRPKMPDHCHSEAANGEAFFAAAAAAAAA